MPIVYALLRLMRFGLAPTAVADAAVLYFLSHADPWSSGQHLPPLPEIDWGVLGRLGLTSAALYCFGMVQNDIVDLARDSLGRRDRPLATGELPHWAGWTAALGCAFIALASAASVGTYTLFAAGVTFVLINAYHLVTKTSGGAGILNLGLIRLANAMLWVADAQMSWPPFVLCAHIVLMTAAAYHLEGKAPHLGRRDGIILGAGIVLAGILLASGKAGFDWHWGNDGPPGVRAEVIEPPAEAMVPISLAAFSVFAVYAGRQLRPDDETPPARRGGLLVKNGLLYLIVLDASFLVYDRRLGALFVLSALPVCWAIMNILRRPAVYK